ncbi:universal stress protein [Sulfurospirillum barnesii]|uniref:Universal stress protein UspA-like protein n=1 Tax=Sulfurospirillum barnesii (strain ATCC 700032 / DSM 10660 / SES-3) TaxID=760154 RepID=I3Y0B1_SULBS|nr:universal stress protein [Sulfurospirillum barnesii]AFL69635.1 universal stress protein UspA-like protein [Sulfurospirillum barnesii SES-3]
MKPTLLVATDFSQNSTSVLKKALHLANVINASLHVIHVVETSFFTLKNKEYIRVQCLNKIAEAIPSFVPEYFHCLEGELKSTISHVAKEINATLIVIEDNQNKYIAEKIFIGSDMQNIIKKAGTPVLVFKNTLPSDYQSILLPTDLSEDSAFFIQGITELFPKAHLNLLHIWRVPVEFRLSLYGLDREDIAEFKKRCLADSKAELEAFVQSNHLPKERISTLLREDLDFETLKEINPELVAMHTTGAISLFAFNVLKESTADVLIYKLH